MKKKDIRQFILSFALALVIYGAFMFVIMKLAKIVPIASWSWLKVILLSVVVGFIPVAFTLFIGLIWLAIMWLIFRIKK